LDLLRHLVPIRRLFQANQGDLLILEVQVNQVVLGFLILPLFLGNPGVPEDLAYLVALEVLQGQLGLACTKMGLVKVPFLLLGTAGFVPRKVGYQVEVQVDQDFLEFQAYQDCLVHPVLPDVQVLPNVRLVPHFH